MNGRTSKLLGSMNRRFSMDMSLRQLKTYWNSLNHKQRRYKRLQFKNELKRSDQDMLQAAEVNK